MPIDPTVRTYDPKQIVVTFMGLIITGFAEGTFITFKPSGPAFGKKRGAMGDIDRVNKNAEDLDGEFTLKQTAPSNGDLSAIHEADKKLNAGKGVFQIKDLGGSTLVFAQEAWIEQGPDIAFGDDLTPRTWKIATGPAATFVGGN